MTGTSDGCLQGSPDPRPRRIANRTIELRLLGGFELIVGGKRMATPPATQRVLAFLASHRANLRRSFVAGTLWPDTSDQRASASLRSALWRAHAVGAGVLATRSGLCLDPRVQVDVTDLGRRVELGHLGPDAIDPSHGLFVDLLPDWPDEWVTEWRESWRQARIHALEAASRFYAATGSYGRAIDAALGAVRADPFRESAHRAVIEVHLAEGNVAEAIRQYRTCEQLLMQELGIAPSRMIVELLPAFGDELAIPS